MAARRRGLAVVLLAAGSLALSLLAGELALRVARPASVSRIEYPCFYVPDERFGFRYLPGATDRIAGHFEIDNTVTLNSLGFHDDEPLGAGAASPRVLAVGDSFTAALNLPREAAWTAVLERELRARGWPRADVVNLGLDGTGTDVHLELLRAYAPRFPPDLVIVAFYANDVMDVLNGRFARECYAGTVLSYQSAAQRAVLRARVDAHRGRRAALWWFEHSYLVRLGVHAWSGPRNPFRLEYLQPSAAELGIDRARRAARRPRLRASFAGLEQLGADCSCPVWVVPVPPRRRLDGSLTVLREHVGEPPVEVVDVVPRLEELLRDAGGEPGDLFWVHDNHLNALGNELFGRALAEEVRTRLPRPGPR